MGKSTNISWTHHTFSPWWGCVKVSPGCEHCYALTLAMRWGHNIWGPAMTTARRLFGEKHWQEPLKWDAEAAAAGERHRVFCASMADVFEDHPMVVTARERLWNTIRATPNLDWLLLTKRPENVPTMLPDGYWPNVWLGTSTEDQQRADERVPVLLSLRDRVPVLFLSVEPQIGPVDLSAFLPFYTACGASRDSETQSALNDLFKAVVRRMGGPGLDWIIVGGESGPKHRPFELDWARALRNQCQAHGIAFHFKQVGGLTHAAGGCDLDGREWKDFPDVAQIEHARKNRLTAVRLRATTHA